MHLHKEKLKWELLKRIFMGSVKKIFNCFTGNHHKTIDQPVRVGYFPSGCIVRNFEFPINEEDKYILHRYQVSNMKRINNFIKYLANKIK